MPSALCGYEGSDGVFRGVGQRLVFASAAAQHVAALFSAGGAGTCRHDDDVVVVVMIGDGCMRPGLGWRGSGRCPFLWVLAPARPR